MMGSHVHNLLNHLSPEKREVAEKNHNIEYLRLKSINRMPSNLEAAQIHYKAHRYGRVPISTGYVIPAVCPCCNQRINVQPFGLCESIEDPAMRSDIILFFSFIRTIIIYLVLHIIFSEGYNIVTNIQGSDCTNLNCAKSIFTTLSSTNKLQNITSFKIQDYLNLALIAISILYFLIVRKYEYAKYYVKEQGLQTEDDYSIFVENVPILLYAQNSKKMIYEEALTEQFNTIIRKWIQANQSGHMRDWLYSQYAQTAQRHGHDPANPPYIVRDTNLCWNLNELTNLRIVQERLKDDVEDHARRGYLKMTGTKFDELQNAQRLGVSHIVNVEYEKTMEGINRAILQRYLKFNALHSVNFCLSRFTRKAFVSFEYQEFREVIMMMSKHQPIEMQGEQLHISYASHPDDIYWENMHFSPEQIKQKRRNTFWIAGGLLFFSLIFILLANWLRKKIKSKQNLREYGDMDTESWVNMLFMIVVAIIISTINYFLEKIMWVVVGYEAHPSSVERQRSSVIKTVLCVFINTAASFCLVSLVLDNKIYGKSGIILQVSVLFITTQILNVIANSIYLPSLYRQIRLSKYNWNLPIPRFQDRLNRQYELPEFNMGQRFVYYIQWLYLACFFSYILPIGVFIILVAFIIHYFLDKINLFLRSSMNQRFGLGVMRTMYQMMESCLLVFVIGNAFWSWHFGIPFLRPVNIAAIALAALYFIFIWWLPLEKQYKLLCFRPDFEDRSYTECLNLHKFEQTYDMENPATYHENIAFRRLELDTEMKMVAASMGLNPAGDGTKGMGQNININVSQMNNSLIRKNAQFV